MAADVAPAMVLNGKSVPLETSRRRRSGVLNVWTEPSMQQLISSRDDYPKEETDIPQTSSVENGDTSLEDDGERHQIAFLAAMELLNGVVGEDGHRKSSDPSIHHRNFEIKRSKLKQQRCLSDTNPYKLDIAPCVDHRTSSYSLAGCDSGIAETFSRNPEESSLGLTPITLSDGESSPPVKTVVTTSNKTSNYMKRAGSLDEQVLRQLQLDDDTSSHHSGASSGSKTRRVPMTKHLSLCSMGGSSTSYSSCHECASNTSIATDILSGLGFDDFGNPELIPDRFIPNEIEHAKPSVMRDNAIFTSCTSTPLPPPPPPPPPLPRHTVIPPVSDAPDYDLPLGATADNFLTSKGNRSQSPPPSSPPSSYVPPVSSVPYQYVDMSAVRRYSIYAGINPGLETVPEETASDLSLSPRWLSPRVSLDHSCLDLTMPHLGASLAAANRKRSLPNREGYRVSVESMLSEQDSTVYFSITSYDDDIAKEKKELEEIAPLPLPTEDITFPRRRRKGVHGAPPELLSWLQTQSIDEEGDGTEQPWPFNEQLRLRRSLTEIQQRRSRTASSDTLGDRSLSPISFHDPLEGVFPRRFSVNGPLVPPLFPLELRRLSLPSNSSFRHYPPTMPEEDEVMQSEIEETPTRKSSDVPYEAGLKLPPGMTRDEAIGYKREAMVLKSEVEETQDKLKSSERIRKSMEENHRKRLSDTQEWLRSELWMKERHCQELEEIVESQRRDLTQVQQNFQISIARTKEEVRDAKDKEIKELHNKMKKKEKEYNDKLGHLEDECKQLRFKETQLLKKINQQTSKNDTDDLHREIARLKEQLRKEKESIATVIKEKNLELKQMRSRAQLEKEEALKQLKEHLLKAHDLEVNSLKQQFLKATTGFSETCPSKTISSGLTPTKVEVKKIRNQMERLDLELRKKQEETNELQTHLMILHKEHLVLEKQIAKSLPRK